MPAKLLPACARAVAAVPAAGLEQLAAAHAAGHRHFFGDHTPFAERHAFAAWLAPLRKVEWVVYAKRPFAGPQAVLATPSGLST